VSKDTNYYFWGVTNNEEVWRVLHEHFEKLSREDDVREAVFTERKAAKKK
jgi:hypothetical protein